jgi:ATP-dependent RNA helicase DOB1
LPYLLVEKFYHANNSQELRQLEAQHASMNIPDEGIISEYYECRKQLAEFKENMRAVISQPNHCLPFLQPGRLVEIKYMDYNFG